MKFIEKDGIERHKGWIYEIEFVGEGEYNGWSYIGQSRQKEGWQKRVMEHFNHPSESSFIDNVCQKYDPSNFRAHLVTEYIMDTEEELIAKLNDCEQYYIRLFGSFKDWGCGFNLTTGGGECVVCYETRMKQSEAHKKRLEDPDARRKTSELNKKRYQDPEERRKTSEAARKQWEDPSFKQKMSETHKKRYESPEERRKTSDAVKAALASPEMRKKISDAVKASLANPDVRNKWSEAVKKRFEDPEERRKQSERLKGKNAKPCQLLDLECGFVYDFTGSNNAGNFLGISVSQLGQYKTKPYKKRWIFIPGEKAKSLSANPINYANQAI